MPLAFSTGTSSHPKNTLQKRKFKIKVVVLLHILIPGVMLSSLKTINPWLSACDLAQPAPPDLQGSCSATHLSSRTMPQRDGEILSCPMSCPVNQSSSDPQCLAYLDETRKNAICNFSSGSGSEWLKKFLGQIRLRHCCEYKIIESLSGVLLERVLKGKEECFQIIDNLVDVDNLAARVSCEFTEVLSRFDCGQSYSVRFSCEDCKEAYRQWVCSSLVPFFNGTTRVRPCRSVCQAVEQKCPYFLPENRAPSLPTQYAGEPTFLCVDPNIPETGEQLKRSLYPEKGSCCVRPCGAPRDGLCLENGTRCEELLPYENATTDECNGTDTSVTRTPNEDCPGPSTHPSFKASSGPATTSHPFLLLLSTFLTIQASHPNCYHHLLMMLLLPLLLLVLVLVLHSTSLGVLHFLACFYFISFPPATGFVKIKASYHLIKISKLILNYFKFNSNKWQYYFILISVNLGAGRSRYPRTPSPQTRKILNGLYVIKSENIRRHFKRHCIKILSDGAQKLIWRKLCGLTRNKKSIFEYLVIETLTTDECGISINDNSYTINRITFYSMIILKILLKQILHCRLNRKRKELCNAFIKQYMGMNYCSSYFNIRLLLILMNNPYIRTNVVSDKSICMFLHNTKSHKFVFYYLKACNDCGEKYEKLRVIPVSVTSTRWIEIFVKLLRCNAEKQMFICNTLNIFTKRKKNKTKPKTKIKIN